MNKVLIYLTVFILTVFIVFNFYVWWAWDSINL